MRRPVKQNAPELAATYGGSANVHAVLAGKFAAPDGNVAR